MGKAHDNIVSGSWEPNAGQAYLRQQGLNEKTAKEAVLHATNILGLRKAESKRNNSLADELAYSIMLRGKEENPSVFEPMPPKPSWVRGLSIDAHIEAPMHLLFEGITESTVKLIQEWTITKRVQQDFLENVSERLDGIHDLRLTWCKAEPYGYVLFCGDSTFFKCY